MKTKALFIALLCTAVSQVRAQHSIPEQFMHDEALQDTIIASIVPNHTLMSKLIGKIAENRPLHEMVIQHLTRLLDEKSAGGGEHEHSTHDTKSHYVGDENREIKALSEADTRSLLNGEGMGMAMPAELNHYPGPRHVLDLGERLKLTDAQKKSAGELFDRMHARAVQLGSQLVEKERALDKAFASGTINPKLLESMVKGIEDLRGKLRTTHLVAHLEVKNLLTQQQAAEYDRLRGYAAAQ